MPLFLRKMLVQMCSPSFPPPPSQLPHVPPAKIKSSNRIRAKEDQKKKKGATMKKNPPDYIL